MQAKPSKCISLGIKVFDPKIKNQSFTPVQDTLFFPFDPRLTINGHPINFILNQKNPDLFKAEHFKFLGR